MKMSCRSRRSAALSKESSENVQDSTVEMNEHEYDVKKIAELDSDSSDNDYQESCPEKLSKDPTSEEFCTQETKAPKVGSSLKKIHLLKDFLTLNLSQLDL